jgi:aminopeptidase N
VVSPFLVLTVLAVTLTGCSSETPAPLAPFAERTIQVEPRHYDLEVDIDVDGRRLHGTATVRLTNRSEEPANHIPLLLYRLMRVDAVRDELGQAIDFDQQVETFADWDKLQATYVEIRPASPLAPEDEMTIVVDWSGRLYGYTETGMLYVRDTIDADYTLLRPDAYAFPWIGYPHTGVNRSAGLPIFDHDIRVTVPSALVVASNGRLVGVERDGDRATHTFESIRPSWRMDIAVAPFEILEEGGMTVYFLPRDRAGAETIQREFIRAVNTFTDWFGPLPEFEGFNIIELPSGWGSQTDATCILQTADAFRTTDSLNELYHEASHLWNVKLGDLPSPRWEEGLASFLERLLVDFYAGDSELSEVERAAGRIRTWLRDRFAANPSLAEIPMIDFGREEMTDLSYSVGMLMFGVIYHLVGPEEFNLVIGGFFRRHHVDGATTAQFVDQANEVTQADLEPLFRDWMFSTDLFRDWMFSTDYRRFLDSESTLAEIADSYR